MMFNAKTRINAVRRNACNLLNKAKLLFDDAMASANNLEDLRLISELRFAALHIAEAEQHLSTAQAMIQDARRAEA